LVLSNIQPGYSCSNLLAFSNLERSPLENSIIEALRFSSNCSGFFAPTITVEWEYVEDTLALVEKLQQEKIEVLAIEQAENATMLNDFTPEKDKKYAIVFGNEVKGVQQKVVSASNTVIEIPQYGSKHSLNISVSAGVVVWDLFAKMN